MLVTSEILPWMYQLVTYSLKMQAFFTSPYVYVLYVPLYKYNYGGFATTLSVWCTMCRVILKHFLDILKLIVWFEHLLYFAVLSRDWLSQRPYERPKAALCCSKKGLGQRLAVERKAVKRAHAHSLHSLRIFRKVAPTIYILIYIYVLYYILR